ncbi:hypothetical protein GH714_000483 [Hevea brasiliensis]|uniref:Uncharacterized protein n=1 Tax=Hevea brasiliensis TaxID=3981 RepID=A0A6A6M625_HEVBR|nr:hypothetical protein GH714_000483 [Hevea brasiliensis]
MNPTKFIDHGKEAGPGSHIIWGHEVAFKIFELVYLVLRSEGIESGGGFILYLNSDGGACSGGSVPIEELVCCGGASMSMERSSCLKVVGLVMGLHAGVTHLALERVTQEYFR